MSVPTTAGASWFWRWGAPATAGGGALAAAGLAVWLSGSAVAGRAGEVAVSAAAFSATLLLCWTVGRRPARLAPVDASRLTDALLATVVVSAVLVVATARLDGPSTFDELRSLIEYGHMPLGEIARTYNDPDNHVLHTLAVGVVHHFGGWSLPALRLPAFASFCLLLPALWWFARKEYGPTAATFATVFAATSPLLVDYATHARGYTLLVLMFMAMLLCGRALVQRPDRTALWAAWAVAAALGFYTVPLMVFPALTTAAWMLLARWREGGRTALRAFAVKTAAWSLAALAGAALLYAPIFGSMGVQGMYEVLVSHIDPKHVLSAFALLWRPFAHWQAWNFKFPAGAPGVVFALVVAGVAVPARRSRLGVGALLLAAGLATGLLLAAKPFLPTPRMTLWMVPLFMTAAGVGAAFVLEQAVAWAGARWPRIAAGTARRTAVAGATVLVAGVLAHWSTQPGWYGRQYVPIWRIPAMASSVAPLMEPGDHFAAFRMSKYVVVVHMRRHLQVDFNAGLWFPFGQFERGWAVHQVTRAGDESRVSDAGTNPSAEQRRGQGRLFVLYPRHQDEYEAFGKEFVDVHPPDHELVAALDGGLVYVLNDWTKHPWSEP